MQLADSNSQKKKNKLVKMVWPQARQINKMKI